MSGTVARPASGPVSVLVSALVAAFVVAGCVSEGYQAPVSDRSPTPVVRGNAPPGTLSAVPNAPDAATASNLYTVRPGDTLYSIARRFGQDVRQLADWNALDSAYHVTPGQVLRVAPPDGQAQPPVAESNPIGGSSVEQRPLGSGPGVVAPGGVAATAGVALPGASAATQAPIGQGEAPLKNGPIGQKRPYSDAALAELSRPDAGDAGTVGAAPPAAQVALAATSNAPEQNGDDLSIGWIWPAKGPLLSEFNDPRNKGIDIAGKLGDPILASGSGTVIYVGQGLRGLGNLVVVKHSEGVISVYAHNSKILVANNQPVKKGEQIAEMGKSDSEKVELHFEIRRQGAPVDPMKYLPSR